eukprot:g57053.t1
MCGTTGVALDEVLPHLDLQRCRSSRTAIRLPPLGNDPLGHEMRIRVYMSTTKEKTLAQMLYREAPQLQATRRSEEEGEEEEEEEEDSR